ncbi:MAG: glycosyltransferase [Burkholderiales bacterium]
MQVIQIDVIIATHNRARLLDRCLRGILTAATAPEFRYAISVVDNDSTDGTSRVIAQLARESGGLVRAFGEKRLGKSFAINTGISATSGDVIAFMDDDQVAGPDWLRAIHRAFDEGFDFVTGPVHGDWEFPPPAWYDERLRGVISLCDPGPKRFELVARDVFSGGNAAVTRAAMERVGGLHTALGKIAGRSTMCEDGELLLRLKRAGFRGVYDPAMSVRHCVPSERLSRRYFRRWHRTYGFTMALIAGLHPQPVPHWFGLPRFLLRRTLESFPRMVAAQLRRDHPGVFEQELILWFMLGYLGGKLSKEQLDPAPRLLAGGRDESR